MEPSTRETIGAYRVVRPLGRGGMGEVFLAYDERLGRLVALKRLRLDSDGDSRLRGRLRREARSVARLNHPNVVQVYDVLLGEDEEADTIVMEYVEGRSVAELLREGPLDPATAARYAAQVARGLAAAHAQGLAHRDLKASNVVVSRLGQAKVLDFGLAKPVGGGYETPLTDHGDLVGTVGSMSPEQIQGGKVDSRSDLFSLGVLLYEMLAGKTPFQAETPVETLRRVVDQDPTPLDAFRSDLPAELLTLIDSLLAKEPDRRPAGAERVAEDLEALLLRPQLAALVVGEAPPPTPSELDNRPTGVPAPKASGSWMSPASPAPRRLLLPLLALTLALAAAVGVAWLRRPAEPVRIAVLSPEAAAGVSSLLSVQVLATLLRTLAGLEGVVAIDPKQIGAVEGSDLDVARAVAAGEVLTATIVTQGTTDLVSLRRVRTSDAGVAGTETVAVPNGLQQALVASNAVAAALRRLYPERAPRPGTGDLEVRADDYGVFLQILENVESGRPRSVSDLTALEALTASSPRFLDAHLLAFRIALGLFADTKEAAFLARARAALERSRPLAPGYPPLLSAEIDLALAEGKPERARELLAELRHVHPGDPAVGERQARIAEDNGRLGEAIALRRAALEDHPTWRDFAYLADLEYRSGEVDPARRHLEESLRLAPGNRWSLAKLAQLELTYGDLKRAETIYAELAASRPHRSHLNNLGLARYLLGDYDGAVESYHRALELDPGHVDVTLNLADAELARGRTAEAAELYARALAKLEELERSAALEPKERTTKAQCLLHLGHRREAVALVLETLQAFPEDAEVLYEAAVVYALAGEEASAMACARKALDLGLKPRWLRVPAFEGLRADPAWRELLGDG